VASLATDLEGGVRAGSDVGANSAVAEYRKTAKHYMSYISKSGWNCRRRGTEADPKALVGAEEWG